MKYPHVVVVKSMNSNKLRTIVAGQPFPHEQRTASDLESCGVFSKYPSHGGVPSGGNTINSPGIPHVLCHYNIYIYIYVYVYIYVNVYIYI